MHRLESLRGTHDSIVEVRGRGLLVAVQFDANIAMDVVLACRDDGLLLNAVRPNAIRFMPPLTITGDDVDLAMDVLEQVLIKINVAAGSARRSVR